jgi:plastocyanin
MTPHLRRIRFPDLLILAILLAFGLSSAARATTFQIVMGDDDRFHPDLLTAAVGDSVYWINDDTDDHTATSGPSDCTPDGLWDSGDVLPGATWGMRLEAAGTIPYFCTHHCPFGMYATLVVLEPTPAAETTWGAIKGLFDE